MNKKSTIVRKALAATGLALGAMALLTTTSAEAADAPCPVGARNGGFEFARDFPNCIVSTREGNAVAARQGTIWNIYCPARMTAYDAVKVGKALAAGSAANASRTIPNAYSALSLTPALAYDVDYGSTGPTDTRGVKHLFHYACGGGSGVATHIKLEFRSKFGTTRNRVIADRASMVNMSGAVAIGQQRDMEYKLGIHLLSTERPPYRTGLCNTLYPGDTALPDDCKDPGTIGVAQTLIKRDSSLMSSLRSLNAKACILDSTDIQCAPCTSSDKLVVRMKTVRRADACPSGTRAQVVPPTP